MMSDEDIEKEYQELEKHPSLRWARSKDEYDELLENLKRKHFQEAEKKDRESV
jgi:hypothetical protein